MQFQCLGDPVIISRHCLAGGRLLFTLFTRPASHSMARLCTGLFDVILIIHCLLRILRSLAGEVLTTSPQAPPWNCLPSNHVCLHRSSDLVNLLQTCCTGFCGGRRVIHPTYIPGPSCIAGSWMYLLKHCNTTVCSQRPRSTYPCSFLSVLD